MDNFLKENETVKSAQYKIYYEKSISTANGASCESGTLYAADDNHRDEIVAQKTLSAIDKDYLAVINRDLDYGTDERN